MGRFLPTATMQVYQFEQDWYQFWRAPRQVQREAFAELVAFAHYHAAALAHAASPYTFEMILLTMLIGLVRRAEALDAQGVLHRYDDSSARTDDTPPLQTTLRVIASVLRGRLFNQKQELVRLARALRAEDQQILWTLFTAAAPSRAAPAPLEPNALADEGLLTALVGVMRRIRQLEKQYEGSTIITLQEWSRACRL